MDRIGYLMVPRSRRGMIELMLEDETVPGEYGPVNPDEADDILYVPFSPEEVAACRGMMEAFERAFGFDSAGQTVEQLIDTRSAGVAADIARAFRANAAARAEREAARKMERALEAALEYGSFVEFSLDVAG